jgi:hypothetical protein
MKVCAVTLCPFLFGKEVYPGSCVQRVANLEDWGRLLFKFTSVRRKCVETHVTHFIRAFVIRRFISGREGHQWLVRSHGRNCNACSMRCEGNFPDLPHHFDSVTSFSASFSIVLSARSVHLPFYAFSIYAVIFRKLPHPFDGRHLYILSHFQKYTQLLHPSQISFNTMLYNECVEREVCRGRKAAALRSFVALDTIMIIVVSIIVCKKSNLPRPLT